MVRLVEGQIVADEEDDSSACGTLGRVISCRSGITVNLLGFRVPLYWTCVVGVFAFLRFGAPGLVFMGLLAGASHYACGESGSDGGGRGSRGRPFSRGSNIRGIGDLPRPPPSS